MRISDGSSGVFSSDLGSAQQAATPNAAAIPARVIAALLIPLGGLGVWVTGDSLWRACSYPTICSDYRLKRYFEDGRNHRDPDRRTLAPYQLQHRDDPLLRADRDAARSDAAGPLPQQIGRAWGRERGCQCV